MERHTFARTRGLPVRGSVALVWLFVGIFPLSLRAESFDDLRVALQARKALQQDKRLEGLNVGVTVQGGVATLWGPLPSAEAALEAIRRLEKVRGITRVIDQSKVVPPDDPLPAQVAEALRAHGFQARVPDAPTSITTAKVAQTRPDADVRGSGVIPTGKSGRAPTLRPVDATPGPAVLLRPELGRTVEKPLVTATTFEKSWEKLRGRDNRFREVTLAVDAGIVRINGSVERMADAWDLADLLADLPGVKQVLLGNVGAK